jgi:hypothetical protein
MQTTVYCRHCGKSYPTSLEDVRRVQRFDPRHLIASGDAYSYSGGCYFKTLARLKRTESRTKRDKGRQ